MWRTVANKLMIGLCPKHYGGHCIGTVMVSVYLFGPLMS